MYDIQKIIYIETDRDSKKNEDSPCCSAEL